MSSTSVPEQLPRRDRVNDPVVHRRLGRDQMAVVAALLAPLVACALLATVRGSLPNTDAALVLVLVVVAVAANGYRLAGVLASVSAAVWFDFFLTQPYQRFTINRTSDLRTTLLLLAVGVAVTELAVWGRRHAALAARQEGYLDGIRAASELAAHGMSGSTLVAAVAEQLTALLGLSECRFERGAAGVGHPARLRHDGRIMREQVALDVEQEGLPQDVPIELLVESGGRLVGRFLMHAAPGSRPSRTQLLVAVTLAGQVAAAQG
jgi:K+-sensing histidine kinase KdpD